MSDKEASEPQTEVEGSDPPADGSSDEETGQLARPAGPGGVAEPKNGALRPGQRRVLDCMDCHNRPAHKFRTPVSALNDLLDAGQISTNLPYIKREIVAALTAPYPNNETALRRIGEVLTAFYQKNYPQTWNTKRAAIHEAIDGARDIYARVNFPSMNVDWQTYPDNIGHRSSPGCFRCHEGKHLNQHGKPISHSCDACHTFLNPIEEGKGLVREGNFEHPVELKGSHAASLARCDGCHAVTANPVATCAGCHRHQSEFRSGTAALFKRFEIEEDEMVDSECIECHDIEKPRDIEIIEVACLKCHEENGDPLEKGTLATWKAELEGLFSRAEKQAGDADREIIDELKRVGPMHNLKASRKVLMALGGDSGEKI